MENINEKEDKPIKLFPNAVVNCFEYKTISAHNDDLYEVNGWAFNHLNDLGKQGWEVVKIQPLHKCGSWVFLKKQI